MSPISSMAAGEPTAEHAVRRCFERIRDREPAVQAWQHLDEPGALAQARALDARHSAGAARAPLHGMPVGVKDIIDTADMPTENGTVLYRGRRPARDAVLVSALRAAGAVIVGKTVTTELATYSPGKTRNPHDASRTPGGSSSGSAAAVACGMVPLAVGTQTNGSVIRPAAFCGVWGYKPTQGLVPREGVLMQSPTLDCVGLFASELEHAALAAEVLMGGALPLLAAVRAEGPPPRLAFVRTPMWDRADAAARSALEGLASQLGGHCEEHVLPEGLRDAWEWHRTVMESEMAAHYDVEWRTGRSRLSAPLQAQLARGRAIPALDYQLALARIPHVNAMFEELFARCDAILTPAAPGTAPPLATTGDPVFCTLWSYCGMPALNVPLLRGEGGLPLGVQLVGRRGDDARLLRTAAWLQRRRP